MKSVLWWSSSFCSDNVSYPSIRGSSTQKQLPLSPVLSSPTSPFICLARRLLNARPIPVPGIVPASFPRRLNGTKSSPSLSAGMPGPVSVTVIRTPFSWLTAAIRTVPSLELYFTAFESRLINICFMRLRSARTLINGSKGLRSRDIPLYSARGWTRSRHNCF